MQKLPVVSEEVAETIEGELLLEFGKEYALRKLEELEKENPQIASFIRRFSVKVGDIGIIQETEAARITIIYCGLLVYKMLESQAEVDQLKKNLRTF